MRLLFRVPLALLAFSSLVLNSCDKLLPDERASVATNSSFTQDVYSPVLGRATLFNTFNVGNSTQPLNFKIINPRSYSGEAAPELTDVFPVKVWKEAYTGKETSLKEISEKRGVENHRLFEIREHSGQFVMWPEAKSTFIHAQPDSGYIFDVEMTNSGGRRYFRNMRLKPFREIPFEPSIQDPITGQTTSVGIYPTFVQNIYGEHTRQFVYQIGVIFHKVGNGNSLSFQFLDTLQNPINPKKFNLTDWKNLVHGFDMKMSDTAVTYQVAYPIPLTNLKTRYTTTDGLKAHTVFSYDRLGFGGKRMIANLGLDFAIYEPGDWQIKFWFINDNPNFEDE
ncbi:DUF5007 domain-containing protein [Arachidicoccus terrestris]|uniref:DUF5007 domain-containing protein n=1 Tax=Arachidicoccus terrestris TaxID=2875539 RepID=UPI001CC6215F|nr:DUF5007 domain-containing protein [Arachidicoccus terrestris]UAY56444.1 DUF5007 domain-containing protein [Arachidicoccus terrestris]